MLRSNRGVCFNWNTLGAAAETTNKLSAVPLTVKNPFISRDIFAHARARLHIADHGGTYSIFTSVCTAEVWAHSFPVKPQILKIEHCEPVLNRFIDLQSVVDRVIFL